MTTYLSNLYASGIPTVTAAGENSVTRQAFAASVPAGTAIAANDIIKLAPIPLNYKVVGWFLDIPGLDQSAGIVTRLGDYTNSSGWYANGLVPGRTSTQGFVQLGGTGTVSGAIGNQSSVYVTRNSQRTNRDAADDFMLTISTGPGLASTSTARVVYGYVDLMAAMMYDRQT